MDAPFENFQSIIAELGNNLDDIETEQDARFQIINRVLIEVLKWEYKEVKTERKNNAGYSDYLLTHAGRARAIVEAKRTRDRLINTKRPECSPFKLYGPALTDAIQGITQARQYCSDESVDLAVVTNGIVWIIFLGQRTDGKRLEDSKAIVFPSLKSIENNFAKFWDLLSQNAVTDKLYRMHINEAEGFNLCPAEQLSYPLSSQDIRLAKKGAMADDFNAVFETFFSEMANEENSEMLAKCFVESKESIAADSALNKITAEILTHVDRNIGSQLEQEISRMVDTNRGSKILIIGSKGAGKTTFIDRFFSMILNQQLRKQCLLLKINLGKFSGGTHNLTNWITSQLKEQIDEQLYNNKPPTYDQLQGVFYKDYNRWKLGPYKHLYDTDKNKFKIKFGEFLENVITEDGWKYCTHQLKDIIRSRKLLPCVILDNTDQHSSSVQQKVFQYANSIFEESFKLALIITPITDTTVWQLNKQGPLQSYLTRSFYLPVPSTKQILEKRINFVAEKISLEKQKESEYFTAGGLRIRIENIDAFTACLEEVFLKTDYIARRVGWLSNFDIRRSLQISRLLMTSPQLNVDDLVKSFFSRDQLMIPKHKINLAIITGKHEWYRKDQHDFILNLFEIDGANISSPLVRHSILRLLADKEASVENSVEAYLSCQEIEQYFDSISILPHVIRANLQELLKYRLIEPYDPTDDSVEPGQKVSLTHSGKIHLEMALLDNAYLNQMAMTTGLRNPDLANEFTSILNGKDTMGQKFDEIRSKFVAYCDAQDQRLVRIPKNKPAYSGQIALREEFRGGKPINNVKAEVKWYNPEKGYGFASPLNGDPDAYISGFVVNKLGRDTLDPGSTIVCDIIKAGERYSVNNIHSYNESMVVNSAKHETVKATVEFFNLEKKFGFLKPDVGSQDILIPLRVLNIAGIATLNEGQRVEAIIEMEIKGPVAKRITLLSDNN